MASGVLVILTGQDRFLKGHVSDWLKMYTFSILWGVRTDSFDRLGLIEYFQPSSVNLSILQQNLAHFPNQYEQTVPAFSALRSQGLSGHDIAKVGQIPPLKKRRVHIHNLTLVGSETLSAPALLTQLTQSVSQVRGNFRQSEVIASWDYQLANQHVEFLLTHHSVITSPGTYIRQLVQDIARQAGLPAITWSITRTKNGPYDQTECVEVAELAELRSL
jgi:tRNA pseudouridine55 synthase